MSIWSSGVVRKLSQRWEDHKNAYMHGVAGRIAFRSGLGDSCDLLYGLVRSMKPDVCVEIGSARGRSAASIGMALKENGAGRLYAIDPHRQTEWNDDDSVNSFAHISRNLEKLQLGDQVEIVRKTSDEAAAGWSRRIDMIFIDGDHSFEGVKRDWDLFVPHVREFGVVIFHDTLWDLRPDPRWQRNDMGVPAFVEQLRQEGYPVLTIDRDFGVSLVQPAKGGVPLRQ
jgi:predicted O-methyltransferase YrrM